MLDAKGHRLQLRRDKQRNLEQLISPSGHTITFRYDAEDRITEATDDAGKVRKYFYGAGGHLETVANAAHPLYRFEYACTLRSPGYDPCLMTSIADGSWNVLLRNTYNNRGMIAEQRLANGDVYTYSYVLNQKNVIAETIVGLPTGKKRKFFFEHGVVAKEE